MIGGGRRDVYLERGGRGGSAELGAPLPEHLLELRLEDGGVGRAGVLARGLEAGEHLLEVVHAVLRAVAELPVPRRRAGALAARRGVGGAVATGGRISRHGADQGGAGGGCCGWGLGGRDDGLDTALLLVSKGPSISFF